MINGKIHVSLLTALLIAAALFCTACGSRASTPRAAGEIIEEIVVNYGHYGGEASARVKDLLKEIYKKYPQARNNFQLMLRNIDQLELLEPVEDKSV